MVVESLGERKREGWRDICVQLGVDIFVGLLFVTRATIRTCSYIDTVPCIPCTEKQFYFILHT